MLALLLAFAGLFWSCVLLAQKPLTLAGSAENVAKDMPRGCIVTGEWRNGEVWYGISGPVLS